MADSDDRPPEVVLLRGPSPRSFLSDRVIRLESDSAVPASKVDLFMFDGCLHAIAVPKGPNLRGVRYDGLRTCAAAAAPATAAPAQ